MEKVEVNRKPRERYPKDFKIKVLKDMYENNLSHSFTVKKYGISCQEVLKYWIKLCRKKENRLDFVNNRQPWKSKKKIHSLGQ